MVVDHGGKLLGVVALQDLMKFLSLKLDLEPHKAGKSQNSNDSGDEKKQ